VARAETVDRQLRRSSTVAGIGDGIVAVALPLLATRVTTDPLAIASVIAAQHLPWVLVHLAGRVSSYDRRTLVGLADTARAIGLGVLGVLALTNAETMLTIQLVAFVVGVGEAWTDRIEAESGSAGSLGTRGMLAIGLIGFPLGGLLYEMTPGPATPLLADVLLFTVASTFALTIRRPVRPARNTPSAGTSTEVRLPPATVPVLVSSAVASLAASGMLGILVLFATNDLGLGAPAFGFLMAGLAGSTAVGGLVAPIVGERIGVRAGLALGLVVAGGSVAAASLVADPTHPWLGAIALGATAAAGMIATVLGRARLQLAAGQRSAASALERLHLVTWAAIPAGALAAGWAARHMPLHRVLLGFAGTWVLAAVIATVTDQTPAKPTWANHPPMKRPAANRGAVGANTTVGNPPVR
jgi:hypothetical protein